MAVQIFRNPTITAPNAKEFTINDSDGTVWSVLPYTAMITPICSVYPVTLPCGAVWFYVVANNCIITKRE